MACNALLILYKYATKIYVSFFFAKKTSSSPKYAKGAERLYILTKLNKFLQNAPYIRIYT